MHAQRAQLLLVEGAGGSAEDVRASLAEVRAREAGAVASLAAIVQATRERQGTSPLPFFAAVTRLCRQWPYRVELTTQGTNRPLPPAIHCAAYRTCQEALTNAAKHAPEATLHLHLALLEGTLRVEARNALHKPPRHNNAPEYTGGYGLAGLRERAEALGGTLHATPSQGEFHLCLTLPLSQKTQPA